MLWIIFSAIILYGYSSCEVCQALYYSVGTANGSLHYYNYKREYAYKRNYFCSYGHLKHIVKKSIYMVLGEVLKLMDVL
jgi:hypothetical protein